MIKNKRIAVLTTHSFGYIDFLVEKFKDVKNVDFTYINIDSIPFTYKNKWYRMVNAIKKLFFLPCLKDINKTDFIKKSLEKGKVYDQVLIIRPDKIQEEALVFLRKNAVEMTCFLFDGIENYKKQKKTLPYFDTVYSYDKVDVKKYNFKFLTNYIYDNEIETTPIAYKVFNISSYDMRFPLLEKFAENLTKNKISYLFIVKKNKIKEHKNIKFTDKYLSIQDVKKHISESFALVDIQFENQHGLSFRVFEALGYGKKLITNNQDIVNYDFYNENNIYVITDFNNEIPQSFFETDYVKIDSSIIDKYFLKNWITQVFKVQY